MTDMAAVCVVASCVWSDVSTDKDKPSLHRFPWKQPKLARKWVANVIMSGTSANKITHSSRVCSLHFENGLRTPTCIPTIFDFTRSETGEMTQVGAPKTKTRKRSESKRRGLLAHPKNATRLGEMITTHKKPGISRPILSKRVVKNGFQTNFLSQVTHFWKTKQFCDLRLIIGNIEVLAHQLVFNVARPFCLSSIVEVDGRRQLLTLMVPVKASEEAVTNFLTYLYEGSLYITEDTVHDILNLGKFFRMTSIEYFCNAFLVAVQRAAGTDRNPLLPESEQGDVSETNTKDVQENDNASADDNDESKKSPVICRNWGNTSKRKSSKVSTTDGDNTPPDDEESLVKTETNSESVLENESSVNDNDDEEESKRSPVVCGKWRNTPRQKSSKVSSADCGTTAPDDQQCLAKGAYWTAWGVTDVRTIDANKEADGTTEMAERDEDSNLQVHFRKDVADQIVGEVVDEAVKEGVDETPVDHSDDDFCDADGVSEAHSRVVNVSWSDEENEEWVVMPNESEDNMFDEEQEDEEEMNLEDEVEQKGDEKEDGSCLEAKSLSKGQSEQLQTTNRAVDKIQSPSLSQGKHTDTSAHSDCEDIKPILSADGTILNLNSLSKSEAWPADGNGMVDCAVDMVDIKDKAEKDVDMDEDSSTLHPAGSAQTDVDQRVDMDRVSEDVDQRVDMDRVSEDVDQESFSFGNVFMDETVSPCKVEIDRAEDEDVDVDVKPVILPDGSVCERNAKPVPLPYSSVCDSEVKPVLHPDGSVSDSDAKPVPMFGAESTPVKAKAETEVFEHDNIYFRYYKCDQCSSLFTSKARQEEHVQVVHHGFRFVCKFCGKEFTSKCGHRMHEKDHLGQNPYRKFRCIKCQERFASKDELRDHKRKVCQEFRCGTCREVFFSQHFFQKHESECASSLDCPKCHRKFRDKYRLSKHLENHLFQEVVDTVSKPPDKYKCKICSKEFSGKKYYLRHKTISHGKIKQESKEINCSECAKTFKCLSSMRRHFKAEHPKCDLPTSAKVNWRDLTRESPFTEDKLEELASEDEMITEVDPPEDVKSELQDEIQKLDNEGKSKSKGKTRKDSKETESVTGSKNFHCADCGMSFAYFASLRRHSKSEHPKTSNLGGVA